MSHRLRHIVHPNSPEITDEELDDVETKISYDEYSEYEYSGNFVLSKNQIDRDNAVAYMCCGIVEKDVELSNGQMVYFAFDYGH